MRDQFKTSEAKRRNNKKWDQENIAQIGIKAKKDEIQKCKDYAEKNGMTASKFAMKAMQYCIENKINFKDEEN